MKHQLYLYKIQLQKVKHNRIKLEVIKYLRLNLKIYVRNLYFFYIEEDANKWMRYKYILKFDDFK